MMKFYKVWCFNSTVKDETPCIMCDSFESLNAAKNSGLDFLNFVKGDSYYIVREYSSSINNFIGGSFSTDTGKTVFDSRNGTTDGLVEVNVV